ncbi:unnamed protein product [Dovyalis caffra]|uniref:ArsA/GET3 Anion-transporting ATPase-like domain-containing protein n=1 Tax=Dovyalis caffra TaxID=77055 RepID=A0AAV1QSV4_9ROSI|nr:unnamed protein product [Dovyalis caffra]
MKGNSSLRPNTEDDRIRRGIEDIRADSFVVSEHCKALANFNVILHWIAVVGVGGTLCIPSALYLLLEDHAFGFPQGDLSVIFNRPSKSLVPRVSVENAAEVVKPKGRAGSRKAPAKKQEKPSLVLEGINDDDEIESLKDRLDAYRLDSSLDPSVGNLAFNKMAVMKFQMLSRNETSEFGNSDIILDTETDELQVKARRGAAQKRPPATASVISDSKDGDDFDVEVKAVSETKKKGGRKAVAAANDKVAKPSATTKRGGPASKQSYGLRQKLLTKILELVEGVGISREKKRKIRASPFNKKSGSVLGRIAKEDDAGSETMSASTSESTLWLLTYLILVSESSRLRTSLKKENVPVKKLVVNQILPPFATDCKFCAMKRKYSSKPTWDLYIAQWYPVSASNVHWKFDSLKQIAGIASYFQQVLS